MYQVFLVLSSKTTTHPLHSKHQLKLIGEVHFMEPQERDGMCETIGKQARTQTAHRFQEFLSDDELQSEAVLTHIFDINQRETRAYRALHNRGENTAKELAEHLDRHPSNVYEALDGLDDIGLVTRRRRVPDHGGQEYVFSSVSIQEAVQIIRDEFEDWVTQMRDELDTLESNHDG